MTAPNPTILPIPNNTILWNNGNIINRQALQNEAGYKFVPGLYYDAGRSLTTEAGLAIRRLEDGQLISIDGLNEEQMRTLAAHPNLDLIQDGDLLSLETTEGTAVSIFQNEETGSVILDFYNVNSEGVKEDNRFDLDISPVSTQPGQYQFDYLKLTNEELDNNNPLSGEPPEHTGTDSIFDLEPPPQN